MTCPALRAGAWPVMLAFGAVAGVFGAVAVAYPVADTALLPMCFALLAGASGLDEPASLVVDVTPTTAARRTAVRALALPGLVAAGALSVFGVLARGSQLPLLPTVLALLGNVVLGFAVACLVGTRVGEPGSFASSAAVLASVAPALVPRSPGWLRTFPVPDAASQPSNVVWSCALVVCAVLVAVSVSELGTAVGGGRVRVGFRKAT